MTNSSKLTLAVVVIGVLAFFVYGKDEPTQSSQKQNCHPSYSGCLKPDARDYDCSGGSGDGPYYTGKIRVVGPDVFGLDRDGDGWGCE